MSNGAPTKVNLLKPPEAAAVDRAVEEFSSAVRGRYGNRVKNIYLFGSRARGDFKPFSDVDIAVVLDGNDANSFEWTKILSDLAYETFLRTGVDIEAWPLDERQWREESPSALDGLVHAIRRDGRPIWPRP